MIDLDALGDDAAKWADAFIQMHPDCGLDESIMVGWFANAIDHSCDVRAGGGRPHGDHLQHLIDREATR